MEEQVAQRRQYEKREQLSRADAWWAFAPILLWQGSADSPLKLERQEAEGRESKQRPEDH